jgi:hypothetical protein
MGMSKKTSSLKLYVKPKPGKPFGEWDFVWVTSDEINAYTKKGYKRVKKVNQNDYLAFHFKVIERADSRCDMCFNDVDIFAVQAYQGMVTGVLSICKDCLLKPVKEMEKLCTEKFKTL